jgi:hypothetical protein
MKKSITKTIKKTKLSDSVNVTFDNVCLYLNDKFLGTNNSGTRYVYQGLDLLERHCKQTGDFRKFVPHHSNFNTVSGDEIGYADVITVELSKFETVVIQLGKKSQCKITEKVIFNAIASAIYDRADHIANPHRRDFKSEHVNSNSIFSKYQYSILVMRLTSANVKFTDATLTNSASVKINDIQFTDPILNPIRENPIIIPLGCGFQSTRIIDKSSVQPAKIPTIGVTTINGIDTDTLTSAQLNGMDD